MGLAVYNSIILDIHFPPCCYKKLLSPAVVPYQNPGATVGVANLGLEDLREAMPVAIEFLQNITPFLNTNPLNLNTQIVSDIGNILKLH